MSQATEHRTRTDGRSVLFALLPVVAMATLPYLNLIAGNVGQGLDLAQVAAWWAVTCVVSAGLVVAISRFAPGRAGWVATVVTVGLYLLFNYPMVSGVAEATGAPLSALGFWGVATVVVLTFAGLLARVPGVQRFVTIAAPALLVVPLFQVVTAGPAGAEPTPTPSFEPYAVLDQTPNVYWFVLDAFAGPTYLENIGVDTDAFVAGLEARGFVVPPGARTNYPFTHLAVTSALQLTYVYEGVEEPPTGRFAPMLRGDNRVVQTFRANGYGYVHAYSGLWTGSRCGGSEDVCIGAHGPLSDTEWALASATPLIDVIADQKANATIAAANDPAVVTRQVLDRVPPAPYFAMVHLMNPHTPLLRDEQCRVRDIPLSFKDWGEGPEYADAVRCLFQQLDRTVDEILRVDPEAVIVLQGDHGPRLGFGRDTDGPVLLEGEMFFSAFSALRLPDNCGPTVPDDMTIVNTFRIVFGCLAGDELDLLEDRLFPIRRRY